MTDVTLVGNDGDIFTFADGEISGGIKTRINADIELSALPGSGPSNALGFDFNGVLKTLIITGALFETTASRVNTSSVTTILEQRQWLEKQLSGQQIAQTFTSNYDSQSFDGSSFATTKIFKGQIEFDENAGDPERSQFVITLLVGGG